MKVENPHAFQDVQIAIYDLW